MLPQQASEIRKTIKELECWADELTGAESSQQTLRMAVIHLDFMMDQVNTAGEVLQAQDARITQLQKDYLALEKSYLNLAGDENVSSQEVPDLVSSGDRAPDEKPAA